MELEQIREYFKGMYGFGAKNYQLRYAYDCINRPRVVAVFCRQSGKSETTAKISILKARLKMNGKGRTYTGQYNVLIFAPTDRQTGLIADKIRNTIAKMPQLSYFYVKRASQREFEFSNGSRIICETTGDSGETIRGYTAHCIILEEAGSIKDSIIQEVILPMGSTTDADIIKIGTPRGKNHFFESSKDPNYAVHQYNYEYAIRAGLITREYVEEMRRTLPEISFRTELGAEFIEDQDAYFSYELIDSVTDNSLQWQIYTPIAGATYFIGADIARLGQDSTCITTIELMNRKARVVQIVDLSKNKLDVVIDRLNELIVYYNPKRVFVDETGLGAGVSDILTKKWNIPKLQQGNQISKFPHNYEYSDRVIGVKFTIQSKLDMYSNLKVAMQNKVLSIPNNPKLIAQLRDFRYELTENMNVKLHHSEYGFDDYCDSLALSCKEINVKPVGFSF